MVVMMRTQSPIVPTEPVVPIVVLLVSGYNDSGDGAVVVMMIRVA